MLHLSYDGGFKLNCKDKTYDQWDTCLSDGRKYFVLEADFAAHLRMADASSQSLSNRVSLKFAACIVS
jgi:hypothetical protein